MKRIERIEKRISRHHDIAKIRAICMHKSISFESIIAILPAKAKYLPGLEEDLENTSCIITADGMRIFFEEGEAIPVSAAEHFETVGDAIKKILPEDSGMTYQRVFENALRKLNLSKKDVQDWRPASEVHIPEIKGEIKGAVIIWTNDGREILFREKGTKRFIEVDTTDTIGDLISRLVPKEELSPKINDPLRDPICYCIPGKTWRSRIPANVLYPEGSDYT